MKYKFVKLKDKRLNLEYEWMLECRDIETLIKHNDTFMNTTIEEGIKDYMKRGDHPKTNYSAAINGLMGVNGKNLIDTAVKLEADIINGKLKTLKKFGVIYLRENGSYMTKWNDLIEEKIIMRDVMKYYGTYEKEDIKITKWSGGRHYYAKVGNIDVVDTDNNQKWNTRREAMEKAMKFLSELND